MKYYKLDNQVFAFESDNSQDNLITSDMILMSNDEIDKHINPTEHLSEEEKYDIYLQSLKPLTRRQFKLALLYANLSTDIEQIISSIEDPKTKAVLSIEYNESTEFIRTSDSVKFMCNLLNLTEAEINTIWESAINY